MNVVAIGAHPDDIEIGCGATLLAHRRRGDRVTLLVMTSGGIGPQDERSRIAEQVEAAGLLGAELIWGGFEDGEVPEGRATVDVIENTILAKGAEVVYAHCPQDSHQDHRAVAVATLAACRRVSRVLMYEAPTTTSFQPALFVDVEGLVDRKVRLMNAHSSQVLKNRLVDIEAAKAQARYRGFQARVHWAEAFESRRFVWDLASIRHFAAPTIAEPPAAGPLNGHSKLPLNGHSKAPLNGRFKPDDRSNTKTKTLTAPS